MIKNIIQSIGGITLITTGLATFFSSIILKYFNHKLKLDNYKKNMELSNKIEIEKNKLDIIYKNFSTMLNASNEKRLEAITKLWGKIINLRKISGMAVYFYTILKEDEYNNFKNKYIIDIINSLPNDDKLSTQLSEIGDFIEQYRIFYTEKLYNLFSIYLSFSGRIIFIIRMGYKNRKIYPWFKDKGIKQFLEIIFSGKELKSLSLEKYLSIKRVLISFELKILNECKKIIFGDQSIEKTIEQNIKIVETLNNLNIKKHDFSNNK